MFLFRFYTGRLPKYKILGSAPEIPDIANNKSAIRTALLPVDMSAQHLICEANKYAICHAIKPEREQRA